jgi:hypothetical protein
MRGGHSRGNLETNPARGTAAGADRGRAAALRRGLASDDPALRQGMMTLPPPLVTVREVAAWALCSAIDARLGDGAAKELLGWYDATPRADVLGVPVERGRLPESRAHRPRSQERKWKDIAAALLVWAMEEEAQRGRRPPLRALSVEMDCQSDQATLDRPMRLRQKAPSETPGARGGLGAVCSSRVACFWTPRSRLRCRRLCRSG